MILYSSIYKVFSTPLITIKWFSIRLSNNKNNPNFIYQDYEEENNRPFSCELIKNLQFCMTSFFGSKIDEIVHKI